MARSLNQKYFGNRNIGTNGDQVTGNLSNSQNYQDDRIGGEGIDSISFTEVGNWLSTTAGQIPLSGLALPAPSIPGGVQAEWTVSFGAREVTTGAGSVDLVVGETYEYAPIPGLLVTVLTSSDDATNATFAVTTPGSTINLLQDLQGVSLTKSAGMTGVATFLVDIKMKIVGISINEEGSGYTGAETITVTLVNGCVGVAPQMAIVLRTDTGAVGSATNQENAIVIHANTDDEGTKIGDIIRQVSTRRYKVKTADGIRVCQLGTTDAPLIGGAYIKATDDNGNTYFVTKLTAHRATLTRWADAESGAWLFANNESAPWTFGSTTETTVQIENA